MSRLALVVVLLFVVLAAPLHAACDLQMTLSCTRPQGGSSSCHATTINGGRDVCTGEFIAGMVLEVPPTVGSRVSGFTNSLGLGECLDSSMFPQSGSSFVVCFGTASLAPGGSFTADGQVISSAELTSLPVVAFSGVYDLTTGEEKGLAFAVSDLAPPTCTPAIAAPSIARSAAPYTVLWTAASDPNTRYDVDESTSADFSGASTQSVAGLSATFQHTVSVATTYYYRVRAASCGGGPGPYSTSTSVVVQGEIVASGRNADAVVPFGSTTPVQIKIFVPAPAGLRALDSNFTAVTDKPYLSVSPSAGTIPPGGLTLTVTASPSGLPPGGNTGTVTVNGSSGPPLASQSVTVSLVTPVGPGTKTPPSSNTLIIPIVTHVNGASVQFLSDVRLTNASNATINYQLTFTPTESDATKVSKVTTVPVAASQTIALNDIAQDFFGLGAAGTVNPRDYGSLEIRPLDTASPLSYASSRTYATSAAGTYGQFIAAVPFSHFATNVNSVPGGFGGGTPPQPLLSFQQVAQSSKFRTNLGIVEGRGEPASGRIRIIGDDGTVLKEVPFSLQPGEHQQKNRFIETSGVTNLEDGRIEIIVDSQTGAVSGYASVLDQVTSDPLAVMPVAASGISASRYVLPGMADLPGTNNFHSDIRIYNGGKASVTVTPTYYPQTPEGTPIVPVAGQPITIPAGQVKAIDDVLPARFNVHGTGGSIVLTTEGNSSLVATGRTYTKTTVDGKEGTFGQFIPGVSPAEGIGAGDRALQVLQLEQSRNFRSNVGLAELTGNSVTVEITATLPDSKLSPVIPKTLQPNEFFQFGKLLENMLGAGTNTYNARISIVVTGGTGRVTAYGSVIDNDTGDPTYVPAQ